MDANPNPPTLYTLAFATRPGISWNDLRELAVAVLAAPVDVPRRRRPAP